MTHKKNWLLALLLVAGLVVASLYLLNEDDHGEHAGEDGHGHAESHADESTGDQSLVVLTDEQIEAAGITLETAAPAVVGAVIQLPGVIRFDEDRTAHVVPRSVGVVEEVKANLGDAVRKGQVLAVISSQQVSEQRSELAAAKRRLELAQTFFNRERQLWQEGISAEQDYLLARQTLEEARIALNNAQQKLVAISGSEQLGDGNRYELRAPFDAVVVEKHIVPGELANESSNAFTLSDLSRVWATFSVSPGDLDKVLVGKTVRVRAPELQAEVEGVIAYVGSLLGEQTRAATARVTLENPNGAWRPGLFVSVETTAESREVPVSVPQAAIQNLEELPHVFVETPEGFIARPVNLGASRDGVVEITGGLEAGERVAAQGSFIIKSELGKGSAEHSH